MINQKVKIKSDDNTVGLSSGKSGWGNGEGKGRAGKRCAFTGCTCPKAFCTKDELYITVSQGKAWEYLAPLTLIVLMWRIG